MFPNFEPTIGMRAIIEELEKKTFLTTRQAWAFMVPTDPVGYDVAAKLLAKYNGFDGNNHDVHHNSEFWKGLGFTPDYVVDQIDLNC